MSIAHVNRVHKNANNQNDLPIMRNFCAYIGWYTATLAAAGGAPIPTVTAYYFAVIHLLVESVTGVWWLIVRGSCL